MAIGKASQENRLKTVVCPPFFVPTILLYGRVLELVDIGKEEFQTILSRFAGLTKLD